MARLTSLDRALRILDCFSRERTVLGVSEVARMVGLDRSTASRFMAKLAEHRYLTRVRSGRYSLGLRLFELGSIVHATLRVDEMARPVLEDLARHARCAAQVSVPVEDGLVVVASSDSPTVPRFSVPVGSRVPLHAASAGKTMCAFRDDIRARLSLDGGALPRLAANTITDPAAFAREIEETRRRGYGIAEEEYFPGQFSISAPVRDHSRQVVAALTVVAARPADAASTRTLVAALLDAADRLSTSLGGGEEPA